MRLLADLIRSRREEPEWNQVVIEVLAAQVIAVASYKQQSLVSADVIRQAVYAVAGYPMLNTLSDDASDNVGEAAARRIGQFVGIEV